MPPTVTETLIDVGRFGVTETQRQYLTTTVTPLPHSSGGVMRSVEFWFKTTFEQKSQIPSPLMRAMVAQRLRLVALFLSVVVGAALFSAPPATALTSVDGFVSQWNGKYADYDNAYGAQCVDLFNFYNRDVVNAPRVGVTYAYQLFGAAPAANYTKLGASTPAVKGDVAVWGSGLPNGSGGAGHVAIVLADQGGTLSILTQNPGATRVISFSKSYLTGYLRPKNLTPPATANNPVGSIDAVSSPEPGVVTVREWALDRDNAGASIDVHAYVGGEAGAADVDGHSIGANAARPDVNSALGVPGNHGFDRTFTTRRSGNLPVCFYAINIGGGGNTLLGCRTIGIPDANPRGTLDNVAARGAGNVGVAGWALDPSDTGRSIRYTHLRRPATRSAGLVRVDLFVQRSETRCEQRIQDFR